MCSYSDEEIEQQNSWPEEQNEFKQMRSGLVDSDDSYSFTYVITTLAALCAVYLLFHYRNKVIIYLFRESLVLYILIPLLFLF